MKSRTAERRGSPRGASLVEVMIAGSIMLGITASLMAFTRFNQRSWQSGVATHSAQQTSQMAMYRLAWAVRNARRVESGSSSTRLVIVHPRTEADGHLTQPLADGPQYIYYLSDSTGQEGRSGSILWRKVNGTPDTQWAMRGTEGRMVLAPSNGLTFSYLPSSANAEVVQITLRAQNQTGTATKTISLTEQVIVRNHGL